MYNNTNQKWNMNQLIFEKASVTTKFVMTTPESTCNDTASGDIVEVTELLALCNCGKLLNEFEPEILYESLVFGSVIGHAIAWQNERLVYDLWMECVGSCLY